MSSGADFSPLPCLSNPHLMTITAAAIARGQAFKNKDVESVIINVDSDSWVLAHCHIHSETEARSSRTNSRPTMLLVHGLEGSSDSFNVLGLAEAAFMTGANVIRLNLRNCGDTLHLTPTLYNAGLSADILAVIDWLVDRKRLEDIFLVGFSLGGNTVLKAASELAHRTAVVSAICAISPSIQLDACVEAMETGFSQVYQWRFLRSLKDKIARKSKLFPEKYETSKLSAIKSLRQFDDVYTAKDAGYKSGEEYYQKASALPLLKSIVSPTLIITAQDDPIVPFRLFSGLNARNVNLLAPKHGGHGGFLGIAKNVNHVSGSIFQFWVDRQVLSFCFSQSRKFQESLAQL